MMKNKKQQTPPLLLSLLIFSNLIQAVFCQSGTEFFCPAPNGDFRNPGELCSQIYYSCSNDVAEKLTCNGNSAYNPATGLCDQRRNVYGCESNQECGQNEVYEECGTSCPATCSSPQPLSCPLNCAPGCRCIPGHVRNSHGICVHPTKCSAPDDGSVEFVCPQPNGNFGTRIGECTRSYFSCANFHAKRKECPESSVFDSQLQICRLRHQVEQCAFDCTNLVNGLYSEGCSRHYWSCWDGKTSRQSCVTATYFDEKSQKCRFFADVEACTGIIPRAQTAEPADAVNRPDFNCKGLPNGDYGDPNDKCSDHYFVCNNGYTFFKKCPSDLAFDINRKICDFKREIVGCKEGPPPVSGQQQPGSSNGGGGSEVECPELNIDLADPLRPCTAYYYWCVNGHAMYTRCTGSAIFNPQTSQCNIPANVPVCRGRVTTENPVIDFFKTLTPSPTEPLEPQICRPGDIHLKGLCEDEYFVCYKNQLRSQRCARGKVMDGGTKTCRDFTFVRQCRSTDGLVPAVECQNGHRASLGVCFAAYLSCSANGRFIQRRCPEGFVFSSSKTSNGGCIKDTECQFGAATTRPAPNPPQFTTAPIKIGCEEGLKVEAGKCMDKYLECQFGQIVPVWCPPGLVFKTDRCIPLSACQSPQSTIPRPQRCKEGLAIEVAECANEYFLCSNGGFIRQWCAPGRVFHGPSCISAADCPPPKLPTAALPNSIGCMTGAKLAVSDCSVDYLECVDGREFTSRKCPTGAGTVFYLGSCVPVSQCVPTTRTRTDTSSSIGILHDCPSGLVVAVRECSDEYISCEQGRIVRRWCPTGQVFIGNTCRPQSICQPPLSPSSSESPLSPECNDGISLQTRNCAEEYISCVNGRLTPQTCPPNQVFKGDRCIPYAQCINGNPRTQATPICLEGSLRSLGDCSVTYEACRNGALITESCGNGYRFIDNQCQPTALCPERIALTTAPTAPPTEIAACVEGFLFEYAECQREYRACRRGVIIPEFCAESFRFIDGSCQPSSLCDDGIENVSPGSTVVPLPPTIPPTEILPCDEGRLFPIGDCRTDYRFGQITTEFCVDGFRFIDGACRPETLCLNPICVEGSLRSLGDCSVTYEACRNGALITESCGEGYRFIENQCQPTALCPERIATTAPTAPPMEIAACVEGFLFEYAECQREYRACRRGSIIPEFCAENFRFIDGSCQPSSLCDDGVENILPGSTAVPLPPTIPPTEILPCNEGRLFPIGACRSDYAACRFGRITTEFCVDQFRFIDGACRPETLCLNPVDDTASIKKSECAAGFVSDLGSCSQRYLICKNGKLSQELCPDGRRFVDGACRPESMCFPVTSASPLTTHRALCTEGAVTSFGVCYHEYLVCANGRFVRRLCPNGFRFYRGQCSHPSVCFARLAATTPPTSPKTIVHH